MQRRLTSNTVVRAATVAACVGAWAIAGPAVAVARDVPGHAEVRGSGHGMTFDFHEAAIQTVLATLARAGGVNIVAGKEVTGAVTLHLENVGWRDALMAVLRTQKLDMNEDTAGTIRVAPADVVRSELVAEEEARNRRMELMPLETRMFRPSFSDAAEMKTAIEKILSPRGHIEIDPRTNTLLISDIRERLPQVLAVADTLDTSTPQIEIVAKLIDMDTAAAQELGARWQVITGDGKNRVRQGFGPGSDNGNTDITDMKDWLDPTKPPNEKWTPPVTNGDIAAHVTHKFGTFGLVEGFIAALENERKAELLSNPRIVTVNNKEASITVGQEIPLIVSDVAGNAVTTLKQIGIKLRVTPRINPEVNTITLDVHPEVSDLSSQATVQGGVIINTSLADTRVVVKDGETAMIGGLIREVESRVTQRVPVLGKLPLIGRLFRYENTVKQRRELVIFITPRVAPPATG